MSEQTSVVEPSGDGPKRRGKVSKRHTVGTVLVSSLVVLGLVTGLSVVFIYRHLNGNITTSDALDQVDNRPPAKETKALNVLVLGSDTREGEGNRIDGEAGGGASDTTILLHLSADRERAYGISIPRDSLVTRPDCGEDNEIAGGEEEMWNAAYALGGEACTIEQFEQSTGVRVDDFIVIDFNGFKDMVDAVDGVPVCIPEDIDDPAHDIFIPAGDRVLEGEEALNYVRVRYTLGNGSDIGRIKRQQAFIASMINKVVSAGTLARPDRLLGFLDAATKSLAAVSPGLNNLSRLAKLGLSLQDVGLDNIQFITVPSGPAPQDPNRIAWLPEAEKVWKKIAADKPLSRRLTSDAIDAGRPPGAPASPSTPSTESPSPSEGESSDAPSVTPSPTITPTPSAEDVAEAEANGLCA